MAETVTPNDLPGAIDTTKPNSDTDKSTATTETKSSKSATGDKAPADGALTSGERAELERLRSTHKDEQKYRREATENHRDAEAYRQLAPVLREKLGIDDQGKDFDPQAAIADLSSKFESERQARIRADVARTEGVEPDDFSGSNEDEMRASAQRFKARIEAEVEKRAKAVAPAAAPASDVTAKGKVDGARQITSIEQLDKMTPKQIVQAQKDGLLDDLLTGKAT